MKRFFSPMVSEKPAVQTAQATYGDGKTGPVTNAILTDEYIKMLTSFIYFWAWPMVNVHNRKLAMQKVPEQGLLGGIVVVSPPNTLAMLTDYINPLERLVACPNQDVVYGFGIMDFTKEPVVIQVPDFGDRFWVYQICDQRTDGFANIGKMYGTKPGFYLLTGPNWNGKVPDGITETFSASTYTGVIAPRAFQSDDPADKKAIQPILQQIMMYPLTQFDGKLKTKDWTKLPQFPSESGGDKETKWVDPETFFDVLSEVLDEVPPLQGEGAIYVQAHSLLGAIAADPKLKKLAIEAATEAEKKLITPLLQFVNVGYPAKNNWTTQNNGAQFGTDYLTRTAVAKSNIFVNKPNETRYFYQDRDAAGARLNGANKYKVTFLKGEIPPVKGFWSLTLYNQYHFFSPNDLNRYSLGTKNKDLQFNSDGSLTFCVQNEAPEESKKTNWLPAPKEDFCLFIRCYWPEERVLTDNWAPPAVEKL